MLHRGDWRAQGCGKKKDLLVQKGRSQNKARNKAAVVQFGIHQTSLLEALPTLRKAALSVLDPPFTKICYLRSMLTSPLRRADKHACLTKQVPPQGLQSYKTAPSLQFLWGPPLFLGHSNITDARAIYTACLQLRHHNHSLNAGTDLEKALLTGGDYCNVPCEGLLSWTTPSCRAAHTAATCQQAGTGLRELCHLLCRPPSIF